MNIDEILAYHNKAIEYLEMQLVPLENEPELRRPVDAGLDFHRRAIVTLIAAREMFHKQQAKENATQETPDGKAGILSLKSRRPV